MDLEKRQASIKANNKRRDERRQAEKLQKEKEREALAREIEANKKACKKEYRRLKHLENSSDPEYVRKCRANSAVQNAKRKNNPEQKRKMNEQRRRRYWSDPDYRAHILEYQKARRDRVAAASSRDGGVGGECCAHDAAGLMDSSCFPNDSSL